MQAMLLQGMYEEESACKLSSLTFLLPAAMSVHSVHQVQALCVTCHLQSRVVAQTRVKDTKMHMSPPGKVQRWAQKGTRALAENMKSLPHCAKHD